MIDDLGYYDLVCYGATEVKDLRIDAMAKDGIRFPDYYAAAPIFSPSLAGFLTGCYPRRVGNEIWVHQADYPTGIHPRELTLSELLNEHGYKTACIGKWHLGFHEPFLSRNHGFDHYFGLLHNPDPFETVLFEDKGGVPLMCIGKVAKRPADVNELTRVCTDEAIDFIERNKNGPFFLYLTRTILLVPLGVSEEFKGTSKWGECGDAIHERDHNVGRMLDSLKRLKIADKTLVIYTSDNGRGPVRNPEQKIRGGKLSTYEEGIRLPATAWGPGLWLPAGLNSSAVTRALEWYPTFASFAGIRVPPSRLINGRDLAPLLKGETQFVPAPGMKKSLNAEVPLWRTWNPCGEWKEIILRHEYNDEFFYHGSLGSLSALRWRNWKMSLNPSLELYDQSADPGESKLVRNQDMVRKLPGMAILFQEEMQADACPSGHPNDLSKTEPDTEVSESILDRLHAKLDLSYAKYGDRTLEMDLYRPKNLSGALPAILCIHGGGWAKGSRKNYQKIAQSLAVRGYLTAAISYRLSGEAAFPAAIHDCKAAVRFLRAHADTLGVHPNRIGAIGSSAGGHLAALLGTSNGVEELEGKGGNANFSSRIQAVVSMGAQTDFLSQRIREVSRERLIWKQFMNGTQEENPDLYRLASPLEHLDDSDPAFLFITGEMDDESTRAAKFRERMDGLGIESVLEVIKGAPHGFLRKQAWFNQMIEEADHHFKRSLK